jgi:ribosomal protein L11 methyltransferase
LSILASLRGASSVVAVDIDDWCIENSTENIRLNKVKNIELRKGGAEVLKDLHVDIVLANINTKYLLKDMNLRSLFADRRRTLSKRIFMWKIFL